MEFREANTASGLGKGVALKGGGKTIQARERARQSHRDRQVPPWLNSPPLPSLQPEALHGPLPAG